MAETEEKIATCYNLIRGVDDNLLYCIRQIPNSEMDRLIYEL